MLDESEIVAQFDRLVADGVIFYDYEQKIERLDVEGLQVSHVTMCRNGRLTTVADGVPHLKGLDQEAECTVKWYGRNPHGGENNPGK